MRAVIVLAKCGSRIETTIAKAGSRWSGSVLYDSTFSGWVATNR